MSDRVAAPSSLTFPRVIRFVGRHPLVFAIGLCVAVALTAALSFLEQREQRAGERRLTTRANMASSFVSAYVADLRTDQRSAAQAYLRSGRIDDAAFARIVDANRYGSALLLDSSGRVREAHPLKPGLIGARLTSRYWHLERAVAGRDAVSNVVASAAERLPVVAIATHFKTSEGRGVFSTAYELGSSPLTAYLASAMPMTGDDAYLVDANGAIVASKRRQRSVTTLAARDSALAATISERSSGILASGGDKRYFIVRQVAGTPWRFVVARPLAEVHPYSHGERHWAGVALAVGLGVGVLMICALLARLLETRTRLLSDVARREEIEAELVRERALLAHQATHDPLTGLANRALLFARMEQVYAHAGREPDRRAGILFIDLDGFKPINDVHGHEAGDRVLMAVAERLKAAVRPTDTVARLGGDEFAVLCDPLATGDSACGIGERIRRALEQPIVLGAGTTVSVGASVGIAESPAAVGDPHQLLADADAAMYRVKVARRVGRDRAHTAAAA